MLLFEPTVLQLFTKVQEVDRVIAKFSYFKNLKEDVILYGESNPKEVLNLYLEGIEILDRIQYAKEEKENREEVEKLKKAVEEQKKAVAEQEKIVAEQEKIVAEKEKIVAEQEAEIARLKALLEK